MLAFCQKMCYTPYVIEFERGDDDEGRYSSAV